ncbi:MAG: DUF1722 domain-containing protein [Acidobacteria bacterium]|nr:DUF1722 domain-containing protein [Acidobacteriota bacterium]
MPAPRLRLGISACLVGQRVRFDGGHKRDAFLADALGTVVEWISVCPEVESGLPTPRETIRLVRADDEVRMITTRTGYDHSPAMREYAARKLDALAGLNLCGFVLKKDSPSCGVTHVKVFDAGGTPAEDGTGLFAVALIARFPLLPVEDECRLRDPELREHFVERVLAYRRLAAFFATRWTTAALARFHAVHRLTLLAHAPASYAALGRLVSRARASSRSELRASYSAGFMHALSAIPTTKRHTNVLRLAAGCLHDVLDDDARAEIADAITRFSAGEVPRAAPLTLLRRHLRRHRVASLAGQVYLQAHPAMRALRVRARAAGASASAERLATTVVSR